MCLKRYTLYKKEKKMEHEFKFHREDIRGINFVIRQKRLYLRSYITQGIRVISRNSNPINSQTPVKTIISNRQRDNLRMLLSYFLGITRISNTRFSFN